MTRLLNTCLLVFLIGGLLVVSSVHFGVAQSGISVYGIISSDVTWTKANSPYNITGIVTVEFGVTLKIEPGTTINLNSYSLQINGTLNAQGTSSDPINFNGGLPVKAGAEAMLSLDFGSEIVFSPSSAGWNDKTQSGSIIENAVIYGLVVNGGSPKISDCSMLNIDVFGGSAEILNNNVVGGIGVYSGPTVISNNIISQQTHYFWGVVAQRYDRNNAVIFVGNNASAVISNNIIEGSISQVPCGIGFGTEGFTGNVTVNVYNNTIYGFRGVYGAGIAISAGIGSVAVSDNTVRDCFYGIGINDTDPIEDGQLGISTVIQRNLIYNNSFGIGLTYPATVENNTISNNSVGITSAVPSTITYNDIDDNNQSVVLLSSSSLNSNYNWWGTTDVAAVNQTIHDSKDDLSLGTVNFVPFLDASNSRAAPTANSMPLPTLSSANTPTATTTPTQPSLAYSSQSPIFGILFAVLVVLIAALIIVMIFFIRRKSGE